MSVSCFISTISRRGHLHDAVLYTGILSQTSEREILMLVRIMGNAGKDGDFSNKSNGLEDLSGKIISIY